jgi:hypothetical protein
LGHGAMPAAVRRRVRHRPCCRREIVRGGVWYTGRRQIGHELLGRETPGDPIGCTDGTCDNERKMTSVVPG